MHTPTVWQPLLMHIAAIQAPHPGPTHRAGPRLLRCIPYPSCGGQATQKQLLVRAVQPGRDMPAQPGPAAAVSATVPSRACCTLGAHTGGSLLAAQGGAAPPQPALRRLSTQTARPGRVPQQPDSHPPSARCCRNGREARTTTGRRSAPGRATRGPAQWAWATQVCGRHLLLSHLPPQLKRPQAALAQHTGETHGCSDHWRWGRPPWGLARAWRLGVCEMIGRACRLARSHPCCAMLPKGRRVWMGQGQPGPWAGEVLMRRG